MSDDLMGWLFDPVVGRLVTTAVGLVAIVVVIRLAQRAVGPRVKEPATRYRVRKMISFIGYVAAFAFITVVFREKLGGLTVALGVAGAGIAFALQEVIASVAGWVAISLGNFYDTGDRVEMGGIKGDVIDIGVLRTTLMEIGDWVQGDQYNGRIVRIANSFVFKAPVFNYSADFPFLWDEIQIPVKYGSDARLAREIIERAAAEIVQDYATTAKTAWTGIVRKYLIEDARVDPAVMLVANDNWMEFTLRYVVDYKNRRSTKDRLFTRIIEQFQEHKEQVGLASATFHLVEWPTLPVRVVQ